MNRVELWVAEKLKNIYKFNECCTLYFDAEEKEIVNALDGYSDSCYYYNSDFNNSNNYTIPTVSQVMEWILKEKDIFIDVRFHKEPKGFYWFLENIETGKISYCCKKLNNFYENCIEDAIEFLIKNNFNYNEY